MGRCNQEAIRRQLACNDGRMDGWMDGWMHQCLIRLTSCPRIRHSLARSASETVLETAPSRVALADLHVHASAIRKRFASIEMSEHLMREAIRGHQRPSQKDAPFGLNGLGDH